MIHLGGKLGKQEAICILFQIGYSAFEDGEKRKEKLEVVQHCHRSI